jgi:DNA-binding Lrp family transcriptional regulator
MSEYKLDETDIAIIKILQRDARTSKADIAKEVKMSVNAVGYRLKRLEESGYITRFTVMLNPEKFGKKTMAILNLKLDHSAMDMNEVVAELKRTPQLTQVISISGEYDICAIGWFSDYAELNAFIKDVLYKRFPVKSSSVILALEQIKNTVFEV